jgi:hypothetical protein
MYIFFFVRSTSNDYNEITTALSVNVRKIEGMNNRIERIKKHVKENKAVYISGIAGVVIGAIGTFAFTRKSVISKAYVESYVANVFGGWKPKNYVQTISIYGNKLGRPGKAVYDTTTNKRYESQSLVAKAIGASNALVSKHLNGKGKDHVKGHKLEWID